MKKHIKMTMLDNAEKIIRTAAVKAGGFPTWLGFYEPEMPEKLKEMIQKKK